MFAARFAILPLTIAALNVQALQSLDEDQLSNVTGEGIGAAFKDFSLFTKMPNRPESGELTLILDDKYTADTSDDDAFVFSDIRVHRSDFTYSESADFSMAGGDFGSDQYPVKVGDLVQVSSILQNGDEPAFTYTAMRTQFPGGDLTPDKLAQELAKDPNFMERLSDKFDLSLRVDSIIGSRPEGDKRRFDFSLALEGFCFYGFQQDIWSIPYYGIATSATVGILADSLVIGGDPNGALSGSVALNNIDLYLPNGSADQPIVISTVEVGGKEQVQFEMLPLTKSIAAARGSDYPVGHLRVKSIHFGDPRDPELRTALRPGVDPNNAGPEDYYYAFQPDVGNTLEIEGINIQHLRITTQDI